MDVETLHELRSPAGQTLLNRVAAEAGNLDTDADLLSAATRLRHDYPAALVSAAFTQVRLRVRARAKFGPEAERMYFTPDGLEQATRATVAAWRARRYRPVAGGLNQSTGVDLCCGVGGDLAALTRAGLWVEGVDRDPLTVEVARANIEALGLTGRASVRLADAADIDAAGYGTAFCDPARRAERGPPARIFDPDAYSPPLARAVELIRRAPGAGLKVGPGLPHHLIPPDAEAEWVSDGGEVKEAALWFGALAGRIARRASLLPSGHTLVEDPDLGDPPVGPPARYLYEPDGAVLRAGLVAEMAARVRGVLLDPTIAYVTSQHNVETPYARAYEITDVLPFSLKRLRALLRERGVGIVTIKKRGSAVDVQRLRRDLRLAGTKSAIVVLTRVAGAHYALLCRPAAG